MDQIFFSNLRLGFVLKMSVIFGKISASRPYKLCPFSIKRLYCQTVECWLIILYQFQSFTPHVKPFFPLRPIIRRARLLGAKPSVRAWGVRIRRSRRGRRRKRKRKRNWLRFRRDGHRFSFTTRKKADEKSVENGTYEHRRHV